MSIFVFAFLGWPDLWLRILSRVILLPVVAGISYEIIRFAGRTENPVMKKAILPGLWLQKLTTNQPADEMVEVAIRSLAAVLPPEELERVGGLQLPVEETAAAADSSAAEDEATAAATAAVPEKEASMSDAVLAGKN